MATTTNYGWTTPDDTALVKDGASAIRTLGSSVDTTTKALNPSTTLGDIEYRSSTANTNTRLGIGSTGQVLTVSGGVPAWANAAAGGMTLISTTTLTGATVTIGSIPSTYNNLQLIITNFKPATDNKYLAARFNANSSALYVSDGLSDNRGAAATDTSMLLGFRNDNTTAEGLIQADFYNYANTTTWKMGKSVSFTNDATTPTLYNLWAVSQLWRNTSAITEINLSLESGGNFTSGTAYLYGVK